MLFFQFSDYNVERQIRTSWKEGDVCIFVDKPLDHKVRKDLSRNCGKIESLSIEIWNKKTRNIIFDIAYRPPSKDINTNEQFGKYIFSKNNKILKHNSSWWFCDRIWHFCDGQAFELVLWCRFLLNCSDVWHPTYSSQLFGI